MHYNQMIALDPRFAEAWAYLSIAHHDLYWAFDRPAELPLVIEAAKKAQEAFSQSHKEKTSECF